MSGLDFLRWCLSDFWRFAGLVVLLAVAGQILLHGVVAITTALMSSRKDPTNDPR